MINRIIKVAIYSFFFGFLSSGRAQTTAQLLGYDANAQLLIINADDFGMCHAENVATMALLLSHGVSSATVMVPCPWFVEAAQFCKENSQLDVGIHLTLTSEWSKYKWGSVASANEVSSLLTYEGYFSDSELYVELNGKAEQVETELRAQIEKAKQFGIEPTHFDNHMGSVYGLITGKNFLNVVFKLSAEYGLPFRLPRNITAPYDQLLPQSRQKQLKAIADSVVALGYVLPDYLITATEHGNSFTESFSVYRRMLAGLLPGVTELYLHAAVPGEEIQAITHSWKNRNWDYEVFASQEMKTLLDSLGIIVIGWKQLQDLQIAQMTTRVADSNPATVTDDFSIMQNTPNPFKSNTSIHYSLPDRSHVKMTIYNVLGEKVRTLFENEQTLGNHVQLWNGKDDAGKIVPSGTYYCRLEIDGRTLTQKMSVIR